MSLHMYRICEHVRWKSLHRFWMLPNLDSQGPQVT
ncbi:hypothetical protein NC651_014066 [Populus alba x Populus x berolinensis]|nr:hypothetical protein NC651_014066 [Populus alba x Populus x berolinensis]